MRAYRLNTARLLWRLVIIVFILFLASDIAACGGAKPTQEPPQASEPTAQPASSGSKTSCGDGLCEEGEGDNCCTDCNCSDPSKICNRYTVKCVDKVVLTEDARKQILDKFGQWPLKEEADDIQGPDAVKVFRFDCGDASKTCTHIVYVDKTGSIIQEQETK